jgi:hypothetical protein
MTVDPLDGIALEDRLRATYRAVANGTTVTPRALPDRRARPSRVPRPALALAAVVVLVGLGVVVGRREQPAANRDEGRVAVLQVPLGWRFLEERPYVTTDGLGRNDGVVIRYGRGDATLEVITLRRSPLETGGLEALDGLDEIISVDARPAFATGDGNLVVRVMSDDLVAVLRLVDPTDQVDLDLATMSELTVTLSERAWERATRRQGFAVVREGHPDPAQVVRLADGLEVERTVTGTLRSGFIVCRQAKVDGVGSTPFVCGTPPVDAPPDVVVDQVGDGVFVVRVQGDVATVEIDGVERSLDGVTDPDSGGITRYSVVTIDPLRNFSAVGLDADGAVVFTANWSGATGVTP